MRKTVYLIDEEWAWIRDVEMIHLDPDRKWDYSKADHCVLWAEEFAKQGFHYKETKTDDSLRYWGSFRFNSKKEVTWFAMKYAGTPLVNALDQLKPKLKVEGFEELSRLYYGYL